MTVHTHTHTHTHLGTNKYKQVVGKSELGKLTNTDDFFDGRWETDKRTVPMTWQVSASDKCLPAVYQEWQRLYLNSCTQYGTALRMLKCRVRICAIATNRWGLSISMIWRGEVPRAKLLLLCAHTHRAMGH
jgi:hypothetical protein